MRRDEPSSAGSQFHLEVTPQTNPIQPSPTEPSKSPSLREAVVEAIDGFPFLDERFNLAKLSPATLDAMADQILSLVSQRLEGLIDDYVIDDFIRTTAFREAIKKEFE